MKQSFSLDVCDLHASLDEPVLEAMNFLKEIRDRFPYAFSFAPGAPDTSLIANIDVSKSIDIYVEHLKRTRGLNHSSARAVLYQYGPSRGLINELIADALRVDGVAAVDERSIIVTNGAQEGMFLLLRALFRNSADVLAVSCPCYSGIIGAAKLLDIELESVREGAAGLDLEDLQTVIGLVRERGRRIRAIYLAPDYANPSGTVMPLHRRHELIRLAEAHDIIVIEDNAYGFTAVPDIALPTLKTLDLGKRVVTLCTFSKICLPGARVGFVIADQLIRRRDGSECTLAEVMATIKSMVTVNTSPICQAIIGGLIIQSGCSLVDLGRSKGKYIARS